MLWFPYLREELLVNIDIYIFLKKDVYKIEIWIEADVGRKENEKGKNEKDLRLRYGSVFQKVKKDRFWTKVLF